MTWKDVEFIFNRALAFSFSRKKFLFVFPVLVGCGLLTVICRALAFSAGDWMRLSLAFLPQFLSSGLLLAAGVVLIRLYHHEVKHLPVNLRGTLRESWDLMVGICYLTVPLVLAYLVLWTVMGLFYLLKEIPAVGDILGVILSFGPFLLVLGSLILSLFSVLLLFFAAPGIALKSAIKLELGAEIVRRIRGNVFSNVSLFLLGLIPLMIVVGLLSLAAVMTGANYFEAERSLSIATQWFFIMLPFCAVLTPAVIFFFNFAAESHVYMLRRLKA